MNREQKTALVEEIAGQITAAEAVFAVDYRGLSVAQAAELRAKLRDADASFRVVKNSLTERAADKAGAEELKALLEGPTALTFVRGDAALAAKALNDTARALQHPRVQGRVAGRRHAERRRHPLDRPPAVPRRPQRPARRHDRLAADRAGARPRRPDLRDRASAPADRRPGVGHWHRPGPRRGGAGRAPAPEAAAEPEPPVAEAAAEAVRSPRPLLSPSLSRRRLRSRSPRPPRSRSPRPPRAPSPSRPPPKNLKQPKRMPRPTRSSPTTKE